MQKVINANLNGNAYQFDEDAYALLAAYLDRAQAKLAANPDRAEIMSDIEQAIAEKCGRFLGSSKTVVSAAEIRQALDEMGPVDGGAKEETAASDAGKQAAEAKTAAAPGGPKRLYQIREGSMISGVCNGLGAYFNIDVTIVRLVFVVLAIATYGAWMLVYLTLMIVVPYADTSEQRAAAHGATFNAQELVDQAKRKYEDLKNSKQLRWHWKMERRQWRHSRRAARRQARWQARWAAANAANVSVPAPGPVGASLIPILGMLELALFILLAFAIYSLATTGAVFGWYFPVGVPVWVQFLILIAAYTILVSPLSAARHARFYHWGGRVYHYTTAWDSVMPLLVFAVLLWLGYHYVPPVHNVMQTVMNALHIHRYQ
jgi:phage shock protein PspC (stress-responsive transcriptional regulator)